MSRHPAQRDFMSTTTYDPMAFGKAGPALRRIAEESNSTTQSSGNPGELPPRDGEPQNIYPSGYQRSKAPSWHLLYRPFLAAMVQNMMRGEKIDGPGNPPNYLKATPNEDKYSFDHGEEHMHKAVMALQAGDIETAKTNLVSWACNAMLIYHTLCDREAKCASR